MSKHKKFIIDNRPDGFTVEPMALRLLESQANLGEWDDEVIEYLTDVALQRTDGVYFFPEQIADRKTRKEIVDTAEEWIKIFGCFSLNSLREKFQSRTQNLSDDISDFENFLEALHELKAYKTVWHPPLPVGKTRLTRAIGTNKDVVLKKLKGHVEELIEERSSLPEVQLLEHIPALDSDLLSEIVKEHLPHLTKQKHDGLTWYCKYDSSLPDDLGEKLTFCIEQLENIGFLVTESSLQQSLSQQYQTNFMETYNVPDNKIFRDLVAQYYKGEKRKWTANGFAIYNEHIDKRDNIPAENKTQRINHEREGRGGRRTGAGRPKGTGKFGCETKVMRVPTYLVDEVEAFIAKKITQRGKSDQ